MRKITVMWYWNVPRYQKKKFPMPENMNKKVIIDTTGNGSTLDQHTSKKIKRHKLLQPQEQKIKVGKENKTTKSTNQ